MMLDWLSLPAEADKDALIAAGHRVDFFIFGVHWRIAGGVVMDDEAVVV